MRRTEQVQGLRPRKYEEVYGHTRRGVLNRAAVVAEMLGASEHTFPRWHDRQEAKARPWRDRHPGTSVWSLS